VRSAEDEAHVRAVARSLDLLEALAAAEHIGLAELAQQTGLRASTAHRLLQTLVGRGYATQDSDSGRYLLSYKVTELADSATRRHQQLLSVARPHLETIVKVTGESANLSVLEAPLLVYVDQVEGLRSVRMFARRGASVLAHATAAGKVMLAFAPPDVRSTLPEPLPQVTSRTISTRVALDAELVRTRNRGYGLDREEQEVGVGCVAAPIFRASYVVVAALSVSAPMARIRAADPRELAELLCNRAAAISELLGSHG
jgi:DNA-binding IclR family transcriptional regulator